MPQAKTVRARLFCPIGEPADYSIAEAATIGSDPGNEIVLASPAVAPRLARIVFDARTDGYVLENLSPRSGPKVDGAIIGESVRLRDLNVITLGDRDFVFVRAPGAGAESTPATERAGADEPDETTPILERESGEPADVGTLFAKIKKFAVPKFLSRGKGESPPAVDATLAQKPADLSAPRFLESAAATPEAAPESAPAGQPLLIVNLAEGQREYPLSEGQHLVGRSEECEIRLENSSVSRKHALLEVQEGQVALQDLDSVNYTFLGDRRVTAQVPVPSGSSVRFGSVEGKIEVRGPTDE